MQDVEGLRLHRVAESFGAFPVQVKVADEVHGGWKHPTKHCKKKKSIDQKFRTQNLTILNDWNKRLKNKKIDRGPIFRLEEAY